MSIPSAMVDNWPYWVVAIFCVIAAYIDGKQLRVPNKITYPMIIAGWIYSCVAFSMSGEGWYVGLGWSLAGTAIGLFTLLPAYAVGGMGAGDVKMMAAIGAWCHCTTTLYAFCVSAVVGAIISVIMIVQAGEAKKHWDQFVYILNEMMTVRNPEVLAKIATERKSSMRLLPYGIPIAIGTILYFGWMEMLV